MAKFSYRPEIDGLRALAVLAVFVFHLDQEWLSGGFMGVDVFFVISGFLITSIILRDFEVGSFSFLRFYQRRIARIFPALIATALATLLAARMFYSSWDYAFTGAAFSTAVLSIANFHLAGLGDYFQLSPDAQPLLHYWSLSVEEQFYVFFPLGLWVVLKLAGGRAIHLLGVLAVVSFGYGMVLTRTDPTRAFYMLPSRAWELLAGAILAVETLKRTVPIESAGKTSVSRPATWLFPIGLGMILASFVCLRNGPWFPGWVAVFPVLGAVLVLRHSATGAGKALLARAPLVAIGRASYSLYLSHWPVFSFVDYTLATQSPSLRIILKVGISVIATVASYRLIERPCRSILNLRKYRAPAFGFLGVAVVALVPLGYGIRGRHYIDGSDGKDGELVFPHPQAKGTLLLMGDSQATMYGKMMRDLAAKMEFRLVVMSMAGKSPLANAGGEQSELWLSCLAAARRERPDCVVLACHWGYSLHDDPSRLKRTLEGLEPYAGRILVLEMPPILPADSSRKSIRNGTRPPFHEDPVDLATREEMNALARSCASPAVRVIAVVHHFVSETGELTLHDQNGDSLFHDKNHLSGIGAELVRPTMAAELDAP